MGATGSRFGWWRVVGGLWYWYPTPIYPYPDPYTPPVGRPGAHDFLQCHRKRRHPTGIIVPNLRAITPMLRHARRLANRASNAADLPHEVPPSAAGQRR